MSWESWEIYSIYDILHFVWVSILSLCSFQLGCVLITLVFNLLIIWKIDIASWIWKIVLFEIKFKKKNFPL